MTNQDIQPRRLSINERLVNLRDSGEWEQTKVLKKKELAKELGICESRMSQIENGDKKPSIKELIAYHKYFNVPVDYLLGFTDSKQYENVSTSRELGLSDKAIEVLKEWNSKNPEENFTFILNYILESEFAKPFLMRLHRYIYGDVEEFTVLDVKNNKEYSRSYIKIVENKKGRGKYEAHAQGSIYDRKINISDLNALHELTLMNALREIKYEFLSKPKKYRNAIENISISDWC